MVRSDSGVHIRQCVIPSARGRPQRMHWPSDLRLAVRSLALKLSLARHSAHCARSATGRTAPQRMHKPADFRLSFICRCRSAPRVAGSSRPRCDARPIIWLHETGSDRLVASSIAPVFYEALLTIWTNETAPSIRLQAQPLSSGSSACRLFRRATRLVAARYRCCCSCSCR
jgi:hypothetical protein